MTNNNRLGWLDQSKGFGVVCVMFAHVIQYFSYWSHVTAYVCSFHGPIFFVIAGCMDGIFKEKKMNVKKRTYQLLIPYIVFSIINSFVKLSVLFLRHQITTEILRDEALDFFILGNGTVWFLMTFWIMCLIADGIKRLRINDWMILVFSILMLLFVFYVNIPNEILRNFLYRIIAAVGYWGIGYCYTGMTKWKQHSFLKGAIITLICVIICNLFDVRVDMYSGVYGYPMTTIPASICGSIGFISLLMAWDHSGITRSLQDAMLYLGRNSLIIMLIHPLILNCVMYPFGDKFVGMTGISAIIIAFIIYIGLVMLELPFIKLLNGPLSILLGVRKKK